MAKILFLADLVWDGQVGRGGQAMLVLQWLHGLKRLGHDVLLLNQVGTEQLRQQSTTLSALAALISEWWNPSQTCLIHGDNSILGLGISEVQKFASDAAATIQFGIPGSRHTGALAENIRPRILLEQDPSYTHLWAVGRDPADIFGEQDFYFTVGGNIGSTRCSLPTFGLPWRPIWNPVVLDWWKGESPIVRDRFTTVADWYSQGYLEFAGKILGPNQSSFASSSTFRNWWERLWKSRSQSVQRILTTPICASTVGSWKTLEWFALPGFIKTMWRAQPESSAALKAVIPGHIAAGSATDPLLSRGGQTRCFTRHGIWRFAANGPGVVLGQVGRGSQRSHLRHSQGLSAALRRSACNCSRTLRLGQNPHASLDDSGNSRPELKFMALNSPPDRKSEAYAAKYESLGDARLISQLRQNEELPKGAVFRVDTTPLSHPLFLRAGTSDLWVFDQIFLYRELEADFGQNVSRIIDAGANIGLASVYLANRFPNAEILSLEVDDENFRLLVETLGPIHKLGLYCEDCGIGEQNW